MANLPLDQNFEWDTELRLPNATNPAFTGTSLSLGTLSNKPVILLVKNQTNQTIFVSTDGSSTNGTTMIAGESFVIDCRGNKGNAVNGGFPIGTTFFASVPMAGTGNVVISIIYAK